MTMLCAQLGNERGEPVGLNSRETRAGPSAGGVGSASLAFVHLWAPFEESGIPAVCQRVR